MSGFIPAPEHLLDFAEWLGSFPVGLAIRSRLDHTDLAALMREFDAVRQADADMERQGITWEEQRQ